MTTLTLNRARKPKAGDTVMHDTAPISGTPKVTEPAPAPDPAKPVTKQTQLIALLLRDEGATLD